MQLEIANIRIFQEILVPRDCRLAGWTALVASLSVDAPVRNLSCIADRHIRGSQRIEGDWRVFDKRYWPGDTFADHLTFALRHEPLDLLVLTRILKSVSASVVADYVRSAPGGQPNRRVWFLFEHLTGQVLDIPDAEHVTAVDLLDPKDYFTGTPLLSKRHRVRNNLLGVAGFCPIIRRTERLNEFTAAGLDTQAKRAIGRAGSQLAARAASFLLLADSRASFEIEGERAPRSRLERWGRAVMQAGKHPLTLDEIVRLHGVLIEDTRFVRAGLRPDGVFLGERDHLGDPLPEFIGARPEDLPDLAYCLVATNDRMRSDAIDPVLQAAATAFAFVFIHPFQDGNGRVHRCLIHHVLAERGFTPPGVVFPVSSVMLDRIDNYRSTLQNHSAPLMPFIEWRPTPDRNVEVLNDTADLYRYLDCTEAAEFLYGCVQRTVEHDLPREIDYLQRHDKALRRIMAMVEMPDRLAEDLLMFIRQNNGTLSQRRRRREFEALTDAEVVDIENIVREAFDGFTESPAEECHS
jgi:hypothetical protein